MFRNAIVQDLRPVALHVRRCHNPLHNLGWPRGLTPSITRPRRCVHTESDATNKTSNASNDGVPFSKQWMISTSEARPSRSRDPFGFSYVYLPGPRLIRQDSKADNEDGIPDADVAVDDEGNAANKTILITRIPENATMDDLTGILKEFGECIVHQRSSADGSKRGYTHVVFRRLGDAQRVMREQFTNPFRIGDRTLRVLYSEGSNITSLLHRPVTGRTIWVSNIPYAATSRELKALFAPYGVIRHLNLPCEPSGRIVGFAHIEYEYPEDAGAALLASHYRPYVLHERTLWVRPAKGESKSPSVIPIRMPEEDRRYISDHGVHPTFPPSRFLWVGGMRPSVRRRELAKVFSPVCGADNILKVHIVRSRQPGTSTFAHIEFRTQKAAERIMHRHRRRPFAVYLGEQLPVMLDFAAPLIRDSEPSFVLFTPFTRGDEMDVRALFGPHARNIRQVEFHTRPVVDPSGRAAFIEFFATFQAMAAKQAMDNKKTDDGTRLILVYAKKRKLRSAEGTKHKSVDSKEPTDQRLSVPRENARELDEAVVGVVDASSSRDVDSSSHT